MGKKSKAGSHRKPSAQTIKAPAGEAPDQRISRLGWKVIAAGAAGVVLGFLALTRADPMGRNWAATVSPLLILAGYALIGLGIFVPEAGEGGESPSSLPPRPALKKPPRGFFGDD